MTLTKGYSPGGGGQIHWRIWTSTTEPSQPDLVCLHPAPLSGLVFQNIAPLLAKDRRIIAPDYPGYGGSSPIERQPRISDYSASLEELARDLCGDVEVDVLGFHTGCLVAAEWSITIPSRVRKACLIDIPALESGEAAPLAIKYREPFVPGEDLSSLGPIWERTYRIRRETQGEEQGFGIFVEQLRAGAGMNQAFHAAFSYPWAERFPQISCETMVLASQSGLLDGTRAAHEVIPDARLVERLDIKRSVLDEAAELTAAEVLSFLDRST
ncbi:alpha/beta fold hydrolase [Altererythrobacter sp. MF3-039]|uniref:alpha/beta fold hydrolase n=1 Tax=Altererythrobacter sp. MF3-039 TaxID=3252901 RepID=UPI00390C9463